MKTIQPTAVVLAMLLAGVLNAGSAQGAPTYVLRSIRTPGSTDRVAVELEVGGETIEAGHEGGVRRAKLSVSGKFAYDEKTLQTPTASVNRSRSVRSYDQVDVVIKKDEDGVKPTLRPERCLIGAEFAGERLTLFSPRGMLTRDELMLIDVLADSILLDGLLPERPVAPGATWKQPGKLIAAMFGVDASSKVDVESKLTEVTDTAARFELSGSIQGNVEGARTNIALKAKFRFNRKTRRIDWLGMMVKEVRSPGPVMNGVDVVARLQVQVVPKGESPSLTEAALKDLPLSPTPALTALAYRSEAGEWEFTNDRRWHVIGDDPDLVRLCMLDQGEPLVQCNISPLPKREPEKLVSLETFQADIQKALGKSFGEMVQAQQFPNELDYRLYRVICRGTVEDVPIQWNYYYLADRHGRQVVFAFTVEQRFLDRLNKADEQIVRTLRFLDAAGAGQRTP